MIRTIATALTLLTLGTAPLDAADKKELGGPRGGRFLEKTQPKAEFFLEKDRTASITFYDPALKTLPPEGQTVTVIAESGGQKKQIPFERKGNQLVSTAKLPEGEGYNLVVQFKQSLDAKPQNHRFKLETHTCGGCQRAEYACTCDE